MGILTVLHGTSFFPRCLRFLTDLLGIHRTIAYWERFIPAFVGAFVLGGLMLGFLYLIAASALRVRWSFASLAPFVAGGLAGVSSTVYTFAYLYQADVIMGKVHFLLLALELLVTWLVAGLLLWLLAFVAGRILRPGRAWGVASAVVLWFVLVGMTAAVPVRSMSDGGLGKPDWQVRPQPTTARVLLIGLDGADWDVLDPLLEAGQLPNLSNLISDGVRCTLVSHYLMESPSIWTSIATGKFPEKHGIRGVVAELPGTTRTVPISVATQRCSAIWNILLAFGRTVGLSGYYPSWPAEEVNGFVVSDRADLEKAKELKRATYPEHLISVVSSVSTEGYDQSLARDVLYARSAVSLAADDPKDLLVLYLRQIDVNQHFHWHQMYPGDFPDYEPTYQDLSDPVIPRIHRETDRLLGEVLEALVDESTIVLVVSDHGFESGLGSGLSVFHLDRLFQKLDWLSYSPGSSQIN